MEKFRVIVGNIGTVYAGNNYMQAMAKFSSYAKDSRNNYGRAAGEGVVLLHDGEIKREHIGNLGESEDRIED